MRVCMLQRLGATLASSRFQSGEWGSNPRCPAPKAGGLPLSYPLRQWTAGESHPDFRFATAASSCWTSSPYQRSGRGSNPVFRAYQGGVRPQHLQTFELRRWDLNPRLSAYETVLASRLQSTPQYPRQDSNLR